MEEIREYIKNIKNIKFEIKNNNIIIYNSLNNKKIEIIKENKYEEYIVCFETQHQHFENDIEEIKEYIKNIINDDILPIEFYYNNNAIFGGEITQEIYNNLSIKTLASFFGNKEEIISKYDYEIHSWSGRFDIKKYKNKV